MFSKILVANRGEIAVRIIRACKEMGVATVAVYSEADKNALHVALADQSYCIGGPEASESYLNENQIISTAILVGAQAIHPGYGFLSENAHFARLCRKNGIVFIGPDPESMERLSDKAILKELISKTGLSVIPGTKAVSSVEEAKKEAEKIGYPVMLKACAGGGGRGIRLIRTEADLDDAYHQATSEALSAFGDGSVYLEKYIFPARHVELQILADEHGNAVCLGDRDCSLQRRNQKLLEETPSPAVSQEQRDKIIELAIDAVKKIGYVGAGTLEFLLDENGNFWFMEMNVRLQVEHCVTEMLTGIDLVKWQIRIAAGIPLNFDQKDIRMNGSAIECRINAASCGTLKMLHVPGGPSVRFDTCLIEGTVVSPYYDSLLGKLIVFAKTREETLRKMRASLCELVIDGIPTNIEEQLSIVEDERFTSGNYDLTFMGNR
ncbi:MAG: acetyl-CoA carboxylase biotin carboxylase subunit [Clostridia bacterium]|nr:acetyl-CoA carboxylase biotin carboxylase subunit [Clostridia bacterium]